MKQRPSRREFLRAGASSVLGLSLVDLLRMQAASEYGNTGRARAVILLWLWGGPSQLDTFDPKPAAPMEYRGPFGTIPTRLTGIRFGELFPQLADRTHRLAVLRSLHTQSNDHGVAGTMGLTGSGRGAVNLGGRSANGAVRPALGATVARALPRRGTTPPYVVLGGKLHQGKKPIVGEGGGTLVLYDPLRLEYDRVDGFRIPALRLEPGLSPERLADRQRLLESLAGPNLSGSARTIDDYRGQALAMLTDPEATRPFDLSREPHAMLEKYGPSRFGRSCLLAQRLVEHGVPFVQVNWSDHVEAEEDAGDGGWDNHYRNFQIMQDRQAPWLDQSMSALLDDLHDRGMLATTLVLAVGEFGRTPRINDKAGRDHWEHCYCALAAGGGVQGGRVIGESDRRAERPHERPLTPADLGPTVQHAVGITSEQAVTFGIITGGRVIEELF